MGRSILHAFPWKKERSPRKILVMRFQATGDVVITLPWLQDLSEKLPNTAIHFLTRKEASEIPAVLPMFTKVIIIAGGRNTAIQFLLVVLMLPWLWLQQYEAVIDLQNHWISRFLRRVLWVKTWSEFDRESPVPAGYRTEDAINAVGITNVTMAPRIRLQNDASPFDLLVKNGWKNKSPYIILNPAGAFETRNWALEKYADFAKKWQERHPSIQFIVMGLPSLKDKAQNLKALIGSSLLDLTGQTTAYEAFAVISKANLVLSEDSGLMHMAWVQGVPTIAIFGSSKSYWSGPLGARSFCFSSSDLPCGNCMLEKCKFGDNHCLTRLGAQEVFLKSISLVCE